MILRPLTDYGRRTNMVRLESFLQFRVFAQVSPMRRFSLHSKVDRKITWKSLSSLVNNILKVT